MPRLNRTRLVVAALISALMLLAGGAGPAGAAAPNSPGPLLWTAPGAVDIAPIDAISCPSTGLCVAVDRGGDVLWSTNPAAGPGAWRSADIDSTELTGISCPSTALCVAVDAAGNIITSQNPTGGQAAWSGAKVDSSQTQTNTDNAGSVLLRGVSCPSVGLCVAVDAAGNAVVSTDPVGGPTAWMITHADTNRSYGCGGSGLACQPPLVGVSCPSVTLCTAVDFSGNILTTSNPTLAGPWGSTSATGGQLGSLWSISCPQASFCATVNGTSFHAITFNPAVPSLQHSDALPDATYGIWCQSASLCVASAHARGGLSGLLGSYNPTVAAPTWSLSSLGAINAVACPSAALCIAGDDQGDIAAGLTTHAIVSLLDAELLRNRHLPTIAAVDRSRSVRFTVTSPIAARVALTWTLPGAPVATSSATLGSVGHTFRSPGRAVLTLRLTAAGIRLFRAAKKHVTVTATGMFAAGTGSLSTVQTLIFSHPPAVKKPAHKRHR